MVIYGQLENLKWKGRSECSEFAWGIICCGDNRYVSPEGIMLEKGFSRDGKVEETLELFLRGQRDVEVLRVVIFPGDGVSSLVMTEGV